MTKPRAGIALLLLSIILSLPAVGQQNATQVRQLLQKFKNWRYGMVSVYKVNEEDGSVGKLNILLGPKEPELTDEAKLCKQRDEVESMVLTGGEGMEEKEIKKVLSAPGCKAYEKYYTQRVAWERAQFKKAYMVTMRRTGAEPVKVISLLVQKSSEAFYGMKDDLDPPSDMFLAGQLQRMNLDDTKLVDGVVKKAREILDGTPDSTLLDYLANQILQNNYENVTPESQGIGEDGISFVKRKYGNTIGVSEDDVNTFLRITEGLPQNYANDNELILSLADGITYRRYERPKSSTGDEISDSTIATNLNPPKYGAELRYGLEDINYPSLWSQRMSLNALWGASRLGIVLPTAGWSSIASRFGSSQTLTTAGFGINGSFDFPIRLIDAAGIFNVSASFVFDDATQSENMMRNEEMNRYDDHLIRFHASVQYSFAVKVDKDFLFRMRLGGTLYGAETWTEVPVAEGSDSLRYSKIDDEVVGGVSGRIEFMTTGWSTPAGLKISYFDESVLTKAWLQIPLSSQFAARIDASVFTPVFRDPRAWELESVVLPSINIIYNF